ncbi:hypothetical protein [Micromonospora sp. NPDC005299]|uniref:TetR/AcrR family transcriptional regulator n=1 Tax=Micromonospora sp. NPDC005299 TaxID=3364231 RepID=UPI0036B57A59
MRHGVAGQDAGEQGEHLVEPLLATVGAKLADEPSELLAMLRSMLSRPEAAHEVRAFMTRPQRQAADAIDGDDAELRAGLVGALTIGTVVARYLLRLDGVRDAPPERIVELLRPCVQALVDGEPDETGDGR